MGIYNDIRSRFEAIQEAFLVNGYQRYDNYYVFSPPAGFAIGLPMRASDMNSMKDALQGNTRALLYTTYPIASVATGSLISANLLTQIDQYKQDINDLRGCANCNASCNVNCSGACKNSCSSGCSNSSRIGG